MEHIPLSPFHCEKSEEATGYRRFRNESFVDEAVVLSVIAKGTYDRGYARSEEMVLSSSVEDFAGWALPVASPFRGIADTPVTFFTHPARLPATPSPEGLRKFSEPGLSEPHRGNHRWWLFGVSGAIACGILSLPFLSLAHRSNIKAVKTGYTPIVRDAPAIGTSEKREATPAVLTAESGK